MHEVHIPRSINEMKTIKLNLNGDLSHHYFLNPFRTGNKIKTLPKIENSYEKCQLIKKDE